MTTAYTNNLANEYTRAGRDRAENVGRPPIRSMNNEEQDCLRSRAVLLAGDADSESLDTYYYLLEDLHTVTGLVHKNGQLAEAYSYGAYGDVSILSQVARGVAEVRCGASRKHVKKQARD